MQTAVQSSQHSDIDPEGMLTTLYINIPTCIRVLENTPSARGSIGLYGNNVQVTRSLDNCLRACYMYIQVQLALISWEFTAAC